MSSDPAPPPSDDQAAVDRAVGLVLAVLRSASPDQVRPVDWWPRARAALEVGAAQAETWGHLVSRMAQKLQIEAFCLESSRALARLEPPAGDFPAFRALCQRDALYLVAMAQVARCSTPRPRSKPGCRAARSPPTRTYTAAPPP